MNCKKLFASDFDGTLWEYPGLVTEKTFEMIDRFRAEGNYFGIITGRNINNVGDILSVMKGRLDFFMPMTGAYAMDGEGRFLFETKGDGRILPELFRTVAENKALYLAWADREQSFDIDLSKPLTDSHPAIAEALRHENFTQINTMFDTYEEALCVVDLLLEKFGDKINPQINGHCVDIPPYGLSKGYAVLKMAEFFGVSKNNIFTAGDNINDVSMLEMHYGFSLPHGKPQAKAAAKEIQPGVGDMLKRVMEEL